MPYLRADAQSVLQTAAVFAHAQGEISVALVHCRHPLLQLGDMRVALLHKIICQLDQHLHFLFSLLHHTWTLCVWVCGLIFYTQHASCREKWQDASSGALRSLLTEKSQLHQNGTRLGDFNGIWNVNTRGKNWGLDLSRLSGRKKIVTLRSSVKNDDYRKLMGNWQKDQNSAKCCVYNLQICHNAEKSTQQWQGGTLKPQECKTSTFTYTHTSTHNWCDWNTVNI